jgi:4-hydroxy-tetrahydrodipicolinate synthase
MQLFHGLSAFPLTPADEHGIVDVAALARIVERLVAAEVDSIGLLGSTGIYAYLDRDQRRLAVQAAVEVVGGRIPLIVGVGAIRTDQAVDLARDAAAAGADALLLAPVSYTPLIEREVFQHFAAVAAASDLPLCIYNNPTTTHFSFSTDLLNRLSDLPNIRAVKMPPPGGDLPSALADLRSGPAGSLAIGYSADWIIVEALTAGADLFFSALAGILPKPMLRLARAAQAGDTAETARLDAVFAPLWQLLRENGGLRVSYQLARQFGLTTAQPPLPVLPLPDAAVPRLTAALDAVTCATQ